MGETKLTDYVSKKGGEISSAVYRITEQWYGESNTMYGKHQGNGKFPPENGKNSKLRV